MGAVRRIGAVSHAVWAGVVRPTIGGVDPARVTRLVADRGPFGGSLAAVVLVAAWVATWRPQVDPDAWWHIGFGDRIVASGAIPTIETQSWLTAGERIVVHSWLWDVAMSLAYAGAGPTGTSLLVLPVSAAIVGLLWLLIRLVGPSLPPVAGAAVVLAGVVAAFSSWAPRAQTLDVAFVLAVVYLCARYRRSRDRRWLVGLPVLAIAWANLHGSAILALPVCVGVAAIAAQLGVRRGDWPSGSVVRLLVAGAAAMLAACLNPYGVGLLAYPFERDVASAFIPEIVEWRAIDPTAPGSWPFLALMLVTLGARLRKGAADADAFTLLLTVVWVAAALASIRFAAIAASLLVITLAGSVDRPHPIARSSAMPARPWVLPSSTIIAVLAVLLVGATLIGPGAQAAAIRHRLPVAAVEYLLGRPCPGRLLAEYGWAGFVAWATGRQIGAYGNSPEAAVRAQVAIERVESDPGGWLDDHAVDLVLMPSDGPLSSWLDDAPGWRMVYEDGQASIHASVRSVTPPGAGCTQESRWDRTFPRASG